MARTFEQDSAEPLSPAEEHNRRMNTQAERDWNAKHGRGRVTAAEAILVESTQVPAKVTAGTALTNPLEADPERFKTALALRSTNRITLVKWLRDKLVRGTDFGSIHVMSKKKCPDGARCTIDWHWSKDQLFKPGAEKICGMLGVTPTYPNLAEYERAAVTGVNIRHVILKCQITAIDGHTVAEGVGACSLDDYVDLNKALKMAGKSSHIDATLRMAGLSEIFTGGAEDNKPEPKADAVARVSRGKYEGDLWADIDVAYIRAAIASNKTPPEFKRECEAELARRPGIDPDFDDEF